MLTFDKFFWVVDLYNREIIGHISFSDFTKLTYLGNMTKDELNQILFQDYKQNFYVKKKDDSDRVE